MAVHGVFRRGKRAEKFDHLGTDLHIRCDRVGGGNIESPYKLSPQVFGIECEGFLEIPDIDSDVVKFFYHSVFSCALYFYKRAAYKCKVINNIYFQYNFNK